MTGGAGFLGSHLTNYLIKEGHQVIVLDNYYTGSRSNIRHLEENPLFEFIRHDVTVPIHVEVDGILNLACPAAPVHYQKNPVQTMKTSVLGAANLLDLAHRTGAKILQASTSEVYGDPKHSPQLETYWGNVNPIGIRACYDEGKRAAESMFFDYQRQYRLNVRVARIFNTYGPNMAINDGRVVSNFICQALQGQDLTIYGDGSQVRSFCYVDDLIDGLSRLFFSENIDIPINLGNPEPISMLDLASEIIALTESKSTIRFLELPKDDPVTREPDITSARNLLEWEPTTQREAGLLSTIKYFKEMLKV